MFDASAVNFDALLYGINEELHCTFNYMLLTLLDRFRDGAKPTMPARASLRRGTEASKKNIIEFCKKQNVEINFRALYKLNLRHRVINMNEIIDLLELKNPNSFHVSGWLNEARGINRFAAIFF